MKLGLIVLSAFRGVLVSAPLSLTFAPLAEAAQPWEKLGSDQGVLIERRPIAGSRIYEMRASAKSPLLPAQVFHTLERIEDYPKFMPFLKKCVVLRTHADGTRFVYHQLDMPMIKDRDFTAKMRVAVDPETGVYQLFSEIANEVGPHEKDGYVRIERYRLVWTVEPAEQGGGTLVTYQFHIDPAGSLPSWLVNSGQQDSPRLAMRALLQRAKRQADQDEAHARLRQRGQ